MVSTAFGAVLLIVRLRDSMRVATAGVCVRFCIPFEYKAKRTQGVLFEISAFCKGFLGFFSCLSVGCLVHFLRL